MTLPTTYDARSIETDTGWKNSLAPSLAKMIYWKTRIIFIPSALETSVIEKWLPYYKPEKRALSNLHPHPAFLL